MEHQLTTSGGGAANVGGVDFQERLSAFLLACGLCTIPSSIALGIPIKSRIVGLRFEAKRVVDDLNVQLANGATIFVQAKRRVSFSTSATKELSAVIGDFVESHLSQERGQFFHILAVSPDCPTPIRTDLRQILDAHRFSGPNQTYEPANQRHASMFREINKLVDRYRIKFKSGASITNEKILKRIFVREFAVEAASPTEHAILIALQKKFADLAELVWTTLISDSLDFSRKRMGVDVSEYETALLSRLGDEAGREISAGTLTSKTKRLATAAKTGWQGVLKGPMPTAMEFIAGKVAKPKKAREWKALSGRSSRLVIMELFRFGDDCSRKLSFADATCKLSSGIEIDTICRSGTADGLARYLASGNHLPSGDLLLMPANRGDSKPEKSPCAVTHRRQLHQIIKGRSGVPRCLQCSGSLFSKPGLAVEIDELGKDHDAGWVHTECYRPPMRIIGTALLPGASSFPHLGNFDIEKWLANLTTGQGLGRQLQAVRDAFPEYRRTLVWGGVKSAKVGARWVVRMDLSNGHQEYAYDRGQLHLMTKEHAERVASQVNTAANSAKPRADELCYIVNDHRFGTRRLLSEWKRPGETISKIVSASVEQMSPSIAVAYDFFKNWYAPICVPIDRSNGAAVDISGFVCLIFDPFEWSKNIPLLRETNALPEFVEFEILATDAEVDGFLHRTFRNGQRVLIDPTFSPDNLSISGEELIPLPEDG